MGKKPDKPDYQAEYVKDWNRWHWLLQNGGQDPFYADGSNMNLVRNHCLNDIRNGAQATPDMPIPPEMDQGYMARADKIRTIAKRVYSQLEHEPSYDQLAIVRESLGDPNERQSATNIMRYRTNLREAIAEDDVLTMRRYTFNKGYLTAAKEFLDRCGASLVIRKQISIWEVANQ